MERHPPLAFCRSLHRIIGALEILVFLGFEHRAVLGAIFQIIKALLLDALRFGFAGAPAKTETFPIAVEAEAKRTSTIDVTSRLIVYLPTMCAAKFHGVSLP